MSEIVAHIREIKERMAQACVRSGRKPDRVRLVMVSKTIALPEIRIALESGEFLLGENKAQELRSKAPELQDTPARWHFIGHLQSNKIKDVLPWVEMIQSVDRLSLAQKLSQKLSAEGRSLPILVQVNTSYEDQKSGVLPEEAPELLQRIAELPGLELKGLMTIGLLNGNESQTRDCFRRLREVQAQAQEQLPEAELSELSMGMSGDYLWAIEEGATLVRVGSAIFGLRNQPH